MRLNRAVSIIGLLALQIATPAVSQQATTDQATWLFVIQGEVTAVSKGQVAVATGSRVLAFTDRPERKVRFFDLPNFISNAWGKGGDFRKDPPNAALVDEADHKIAIVELTDAKLDGGVLSMRFEDLKGPLPAVGDYVALTIDACDPASPYCQPY